MAGKGDVEKLPFLSELAAISCPAHGRWLILGDFNLIYQAEDKNNSSLNRRLMASFKAVIDDLNLKEIGRRHFTWSNEQDNPTLTRIDRLFCTPDWELTFPTCFLHSLPSLMSDHTPLLLQGELEHCHNRTFHFEIFWVKMDGFRDLVEQVWSKPVHSSLPIKRLHTKLARVAKGLKRWRREKIGDTRLQLAIVKEVLLQLEAAQEFRTHTAGTRPAPVSKNQKHRLSCH